ncbi:MAG TPA: DUF6471 domain-containing protein [Nevskiaceae bacterium]|nr:DUF6471 domain-containing protein [Nevskiaceae bacterium]
MSNHPDALEYVKALLRAEKARSGLTWSAISAQLDRLGVKQSASNLSTKASRGNMSAPLFLAILKITGADELNLRRLELHKAAPRKRR